MNLTTEDAASAERERPLIAARGHGRDVGLDVLKGLGIVLVVIGHNWPAAARFVFWYHMPLFFVISGYTYKRPASLRAFARAKLWRLGLPYVCFVALLALPQLGARALAFLEQPDAVHRRALLGQLVRLVWGGRTLVAELGTVWFVPCLMLTLLLYAALERALHGYRLALVVLFAYLIASVQSAAHWAVAVPLNADVALMALTFVYVGHQLATHRLAQSGKLLLASAVVILLVLAVLLGGSLATGAPTRLDTRVAAALAYDMKQATYGVPVLSTSLALAFTWLSGCLSARLARHPPLARPFVLLGEASLVIMFVHQAVHFTLLSWPQTSSPLTTTLLGLVLPLGLYLWFRRSEWLSVLFLGTGPRKRPVPRQPAVHGEIA